MRKIIAAFSDTHGGHKLGLMNPEVVLYDEDEQGNLVPYTPRLTATQKYLWSQYQQDINSVIELAAGDDIVVIHCGDTTHGTKYPNQLVSTRPADQILIAVANFQPWLAIPNLSAFRLTQGTAAHNFGEASAEILVTEQLRAQYPDIDVGTVRHGLADVDGMLIDYAHHGPSTGIRKWTEGNQMHYYTRSLMFAELLRGQIPPRVVFRGHRHEYKRITERVESEEGDDRRLTYWEADMIVLPSFCGLSEHGQQATQSNYLIANGVVALEVVDGSLIDAHPFCRSVDLRTREEL